MSLPTPEIPQNLKTAKLYAFWKSIPAAIKDTKYFQKVKNIEIGEEEESILPKLVEAKTKKDVAAILGVNYDVVMAWDKSPWVEKMVDKFDRENNVMRFKKDVDYSFTQATIREADAARVKLWKQIYEGWVEKSSNIHEFDDENILGIQEKLRRLSERKESKAYDVEDLKKELNENPTLPSGNNEGAGSDDGGPGEFEEYSEDTVQESFRGAVRDDIRAGEPL